MVRQLHWLGWIVLGLAVVEAGWLAFDGAHALILGDYVTPKTGAYAGQLGPWSDIVRAVGIEPRSLLMKSIHLVIGIVWLGTAVAFARRRSWAWKGMVACAVSALWYLPFGTLLSALQLVILMLPPIRLIADSR